MPRINRGGHFLLTEAVKNNHLAKSINRGGQRKRTASVNAINQGGFSNVTASVNTLTETVSYTPASVKAKAQLAQARPSNHPPYKYTLLGLGSLISLPLPLPP
jgi:hypothetical protein